MWWFCLFRNGKYKSTSCSVSSFYRWLFHRYGPRNSSTYASQSDEKATISADVTIAPFCGIERKVIPSSSRVCVEISLAIRRCFEQIILTSLYPRSQISIHCTILQSDGGELACCLNAALLAIIDAGISILDFQISLEVGYMDNTIILGK